MIGVGIVQETFPSVNVTGGPNLPPRFQTPVFAGSILISLGSPSEGPARDAPAFDGTILIKE